MTNAENSQIDLKARLTKVLDACIVGMLAITLLYVIWTGVEITQAIQGAEEQGSKGYTETHGRAEEPTPIQEIQNTLQTKKLKTIQPQ